MGTGPYLSRETYWGRTGYRRYLNYIWSMVPGALEALYRAEESYGARPVSGFADATGRRNDIVA